MTTLRTSPIPSLQRSPASRRPLCRVCAQEVPPHCWILCSDACLHEWRLRTEPIYLRACVFDRDRGICARCGLDTIQRMKELNALPPRQRTRRKRELKITHRSSLWDVNHIIPVVLGGGECTLDNLETLCLHHHKAETAALARYRAGEGKRPCLIPFVGGACS